MTTLHEQARAEAEKRWPTPDHRTSQEEYDAAIGWQGAFEEGAAWAATRTRVVTTVTELDALPIGSVVRAKHLSYIKYALGPWIGVRNRRVDSLTLSAFAPLVLLYEPEETR